MAKKKPSKKHPNKLYKVYESAGASVKRRNMVCPKCGNSVFMARHQNRSHCGKCGYSEFQKR
ncbi:30S ribosomal protein S27ae [Candidatus Woesearchaeota archaeon]|nr:30S ribosomal protein S27ae [Candidatus Woesearchaeota archaeon]